MAVCLVNDAHVGAFQSKSVPVCKGVPCQASALLPLSTHTPVTEPCCWL
jgi:hypothetical protein